MYVNGSISVKGKAGSKKKNHKKKKMFTLIIAVVIHQMMEKSIKPAIHANMWWCRAHFSHFKELIYN